jgi:beta-lactamase class A
MPRRATTRRPGRAKSAVRFVPLAAVLVMIVVGIGLAANAVVFGQRGLAAAGPLFGPAAAGTPAAAGAAADLQMGELPSPSVVASDQSAQLTPTAVPLAHRWDMDATAVNVDADLARRLDEALVGVQGHISVAVKDLGSGRGAVLDGDQELAAASLYKLPVLYTVFDLGLGMNEALPITDQALQYDSGTIELGPGETLTVAEAVERMVTLSDNTAAVMLGDRVGATNVNASIAEMGLDTTHYSLDRMTTSALDMLHFLDLVAHGKAVSAGASADMLHLMLRQRVNDRLPRLLPDEAQVAHKTGNLPGTVNDVGIIYGPSSTVAVAALISDTPDETAAATGIARIGLAAYAYFEGQADDPNRPRVPPAPARPVPPVRREPRPVPTAIPAAVVRATAEPTVADDSAAPTATVTHPATTPATPGTPGTPTPVTQATSATPTAGTSVRTATPAAPTPTKAPVAPTPSPTAPAAKPAPTAPAPTPPPPPTPTPAPPPATPVPPKATPAPTSPPPPTPTPTKR